MNRHDRRRLGKINNMKIPSIINLKKVKQKSDSVEEPKLENNQNNKSNE